MTKTKQELEQELKALKEEEDCIDLEEKIQKKKAEIKAKRFNKFSKLSKMGISFVKKTLK